jgi:DNA-binding CsgD family transcriptional regulator
MVIKRLPFRRPSPSKDIRREERECPHCGALESAGGCKDPAECVRALAKTESEYTRETPSLIGQARSRSLPLLMAGFEALDLLNIGLVVATANGTLLVANRAAEQILVSRDGLELSEAGVFGAMKGCSKALSQTLQRVAQARKISAERVKDAVVAVHRPSGKRAYTLLVRSTVRSTEKRPAGEPATVLVFILDPELAVQTAEAELHQLYGVTSTEARLANLLMEGRTLDECCDLLKIRRSTGRTHLRHLFEKVGVQRQTELVSVLLKSIGLLRTQSKETNPVSSPERLRLALVKTLMTRAASGK